MSPRRPQSESFSETPGRSTGDGRNDDEGNRVVASPLRGRDSRVRCRSPESAGLVPPVDQRGDSTAPTDRGPTPCRLPWTAGSHDSGHEGSLPFSPRRVGRRSSVLDDSTTDGGYTGVCHNRRPAPRTPVSTAESSETPVHRRRDPRTPCTQGT